MAAIDVCLIKHVKDSYFPSFVRTCASLASENNLPPLKKKKRRSKRRKTEEEETEDIAGHLKTFLLFVYFPCLFILTQRKILKQTIKHTKLKETSLTVFTFRLITADQRLNNG